MARTPVEITNVVVVSKDGSNDDILDWVRATLVYLDPETEKKILLYTENPSSLVIPRGAWAQCPISGVAVNDRTVSCPVEMPEPILPLRPYQLRPVDKMAKKGSGVLEAPTGCLAGDMVVHTNRAGKGREMRLDHVYRQWTGQTVSGPGWRKDIPTYVRALVNGELRQHLVEDVVESGVKDVIKITFASGKVLRCTPCHLIAQPGGYWINAGDLEPGDAVIGNGRSHHSEDIVVSSEPNGCEMTYDICMQNPHNNFVANGIVVHNSGKTVMGLHLAARKGERTLILVHTKDLMNQWIESAQKVLGIEIGSIGDGHWDEEGHVIVVAMVQTLMRYDHFPEEWLETWGMVLLDEAHRCPASSFAHVMMGMSARYLYGVTATPTRRDGKHPLMHAIIGPIGARVSEDQLVDQGNLIRPSVCMVATKFDSGAGRRMATARNQYQRQALYQRAITDLVVDDDRIKLIARKVGKQPSGARQLVLSDRIEHLHSIEQAIYHENPELRSMVVTGKMRSREREDALQAMRDGYLDVLLATQLADEGLDIVNLDTLHLTFPGRGLQKLQQKVGRIMRTAEGKHECRVFDYVDERIPVLRGQAKDRFEWYLGRGCRMSGWEPTSSVSIKRRIDRQKRKG